MSAFEELMAVNVNGHTEQKKTGNATLTYLSWPFAWAEVKKRFPDASYEVEKFDGLPYVYDPLTGYMVYTKVTIEGITHEMWLPVMDGANKAMKSEPYTYTTGYGQYAKEKTCDAATMFDINKTIMRCLVKNLAMFGLGLYIFAGEDLPIETAEDKAAREDEQKTAQIAAEPIGENRAKALAKELDAKGVNIVKLCEQYGVPTLRDLTEGQMREIVVKLSKVKEKKSA